MSFQLSMIRCQFLGAGSWFEVFGLNGSGTCPIRDLEGFFGFPLAVTSEEKGQEH
jgi:hypothetical protein